MRVALIGAELEENLALRCLHASATAAGHDARILDFHREEQIGDIVREVVRYQPDLVGLSMVFTARGREFVGLAAALRAAGYAGHITAGGHFASFHAEEILRDFDAFDSVVHGEGEETLVDLLMHLSCLDGISGISYRGRDGQVTSTAPRRNPDDLDSRPTPTRPGHFQDYFGLPIANMLSSRGCFANCNFCSISAWYRRNHGKRVRQRDPRAAVREMAALYHDRGVRIFNFHDDNFLLPSASANLDRILVMQRALKSEGVGRVAIQIKARPDTVDDEVFRLLRKMGLFRVFLGVESNAVAGLRTLGRGIRREQNHTALRALLGMGLHVTYNLLMFDPQSTIEDLRDNLALMREYPQVPMNFGRVEVYTGTPLEATLREQGRLLGDYFGYTYRIADACAQLAFEVFRQVFWPRNFEEAGLNHEAMRLDYHLHILRHFWPRRVDAGLERRVKDTIASLNLNSVELMEEILDFAAQNGRASQAEAFALIQRLSERRAESDEAMRTRMSSLLGEFRELVPPRRARSRLRKYVASAAATALLVTAIGCKPKRQFSETIAYPPGQKNVASGPPLSLGETQKVEQSLNGPLCLKMIRAVAAAHNLGDGEARIVLKLTGRGTVSDCQVTLSERPPDFGFDLELSEKLIGWTIEGVTQPGWCEVTVKLASSHDSGTATGLTKPPGPATETPLLSEQDSRQIEEVLNDETTPESKDVFELLGKYNVRERFRISITLDGQGNVTDCTSDAKPNELARDLSAAAKKWKFPKVKSKGHCVVNFQVYEKHDFYETEMESYPLEGRGEWPPMKDGPVG